MASALYFSLFVATVSSRNRRNPSVSLSSGASRSSAERRAAQDVRARRALRRWEAACQSGGRGGAGAGDRTNFLLDGLGERPLVGRVATVVPVHGRGLIRLPQEEATAGERGDARMKRSARLEGGATSQAADHGSHGVALVPEGASTGPRQRKGAGHTWSLWERSGDLAAPPSAAPSAPARPRRRSEPNVEPVGAVVVPAPKQHGVSRWCFNAAEHRAP